MPKDKPTKAKFPYSYKSFRLSSVKGHATFIGTPTAEEMEAVNKMAELAIKKLNSKKSNP